MLISFPSHWYFIPIFINYISLKINIQKQAKARLLCLLHTTLIFAEEVVAFVSEIRPVASSSAMQQELGFILVDS